MPTQYDTDLGRKAANFQPLTPLSFLARAAEVYPDRTAIIHGGLFRNYREFYTRAKKLASALSRRGVKRGDTVSVMLANTPAMVEAARDVYRNELGDDYAAIPCDGELFAAVFRAMFAASPFAALSQDRKRHD